ncbi:MAG TPA: M36 family metallopeptidase [Vicinamibacterales bacterium]|nr:M36 family metallopeptidase [Vicinamibacterales bacterium]
MIVHKPVPHLRIKRCREIPGTNYGTPKEIWGFTVAAGRGVPEKLALATLQANADLLGLEALPLRKRRVIPSRGAWHIIFDQQHLGYRIHRAYVTVHMSRDHEIYLIKNRAVPSTLLPESATQKIKTARARDVARRSVERGGRQATLLDHERLWFPIQGALRLAHKFRFRVRHPPQEWLIYVDALTGVILSKYDNLAAVNGRARVFDPNPVVALGDWKPLLHGERPVRRVPASAYKRVVLRDIGRSGILSGPRVTTALTKNRVRRPGLDFECASHEAGFEEVMVYFHLDRAIRYLESLGYTGTRAIFTTPLPVNARASREDNSYYTPGEKSLRFGTGFVDDAEDGETILHEFGHAVQDAICPDFGQSTEAAAMGEGFGDYFAASFFAEKKTTGPARVLLPAVMTWDGITFADNDESRPPCVRRVDGKVTYESFNHSATADEHDNGEIWSATLWDVWQAIGRAAADAIIIESHFQLDGFTTFARGARGILDADRNLFKGRHVPALKRVFRKRGIGPVE